jgi:hypothetical protein
MSLLASVTPEQMQIQLQLPDVWRVMASRVGEKEFKMPALMFEGTFEACDRFVSWLGMIPTATLPGPLQSIQAAQPYHVHMVGPRVTLDIKNLPKSVQVRWND